MPDPLVRVLFVNRIGTCVYDHRYGTPIMVGGIGRGGRLAASVLDEEDRCE
jgi:hypothetical protein